MATPNIPSPPDWVFQRIIAVGRQDHVTRHLYMAQPPVYWFPIFLSPIFSWSNLRGKCVRATASKDNDRVLMVVEIKPSDQSLADSLEQLTTYLEAFTQKIDSETGEPLFDVLYGLLIAGKKVQLVNFPKDGQIGTSRLLDVNSAPVQAFLNEIATQNW